MQGHCDRARQWASTAVDGELSTFERALLSDHLERCEACRDFSRDVNGLTATLRAAPPVPFEGVVIGRVRRRVRLRLAPAVAAMAIAAVGLGSVVASTQFNSARGSSRRRSTPLPAPQTSRSTRASARSSRTAPPPAGRASGAPRPDASLSRGVTRARAAILFSQCCFARQLVRLKPRSRGPCGLDQGGPACASFPGGDWVPLRYTAVARRQVESPRTQRTRPTSPGDTCLTSRTASRTSARSSRSRAS